MARRGNPMVASIEPELVEDSDSEDEQEWEVVKILDAKKERKTLFYKVRWAACEATDGEETESWEPEEMVKRNCRQVLANFWRTNRGVEVKHLKPGTRPRRR